MPCLPPVLHRVRGTATPTVASEETPELIASRHWVPHPVVQPTHDAHHSATGQREFRPLRTEGELRRSVLAGGHVVSYSVKFGPLAIDASTQSHHSHDPATPYDPTAARLYTDALDVLVGEVTGGRYRVLASWCRAPAATTSFGPAAAGDGSGGEKKRGTSSSSSSRGPSKDDWRGPFILLAPTNHNPGSVGGSLGDSEGLSLLDSVRFDVDGAGLLWWWETVRTSSFSGANREPTATCLARVALSQPPHFVASTPQNLPPHVRSSSGPLSLSWDSSATRTPTHPPTPLTPIPVSSTPSPTTSTPEEAAADDALALRSEYMALRFVRAGERVASMHTPFHTWTVLHATMHYASSMRHPERERETQASRPSVVRQVIQLAAERCVAVPSTTAPAVPPTTLWCVVPTTNVSTQPTLDGPQLSMFIVLAWGHEHGPARRLANLVTESGRLQLVSPTLPGVPTVHLGELPAGTSRTEMLDAALRITAPSQFVTSFLNPPTMGFSDQPKHAYTFVQAQSTLAKQYYRTPPVPVGFHDAASRTTPSQRAPLDDEPGGSICLLVRLPPFRFTPAGEQNGAPFGPGATTSLRAVEVATRVWMTTVCGDAVEWERVAAEASRLPSPKAFRIKGQPTYSRDGTSWVRVELRPLQSCAQGVHVSVSSVEPGDGVVDARRPPRGAGYVLGPIHFTGSDTFEILVPFAAEEHLHAAPT